MPNLNEYAAEVHKANEKWWVCTRCANRGYLDIYGQKQAPDNNLVLVTIPCPNCSKVFHADFVKGQDVIRKLALFHSEISEALEGQRKGLMDDKLPQYEMFDVELVDCLIRILDTLGAKGVDVEQIYQDKMEFNRVREDHKLENRMKEGGKKY